MSNYLMSDIHANSSAFHNILNQISFDTEKDHLWVLGDVIDRGDGGINLLNEIHSFVNDGCATLILGNHEFFCLEYLRGNLSATQWELWGGTETIKEIGCMNKRERDALLKFLSSLPLYVKVKSDIYGDNVILTHSGMNSLHFVISSDGKIDVTKSIEAAYEEDPYVLMCGAAILGMSEDILKNLDSFVIIGHIPCNRVNDSYEFIKRTQLIDIDSGSSRGGRLGCLELNTGKEYYA